MWNELVTTALVGTERRTLSLDDLPDDLRDLAAQLAGQDTESALLTLAGTLALYRRAGQVPLIDNSPLPEPSKRDTVPPCSPRAGLTLQQILTLTNHNQHLPEWITAAANAHLRIPSGYLPRLLMNLERHGHLPDHFYEVIGSRGRWLAQQNPAWAYAVYPETDAEWELTAEMDARQLYLRNLRATDPAHARALVQSVWASEKAERRANLINSYDTNLSLDDEPFLEAALDDRAELVRNTAASLLANLPGSAYQARMIARAEPLIQISRKRKNVINQALTVGIHVPDASNPSMIRDGIPAAPPKGSNLSEGALWLAAIAGWLPSSYWLSGDWSPLDLVRAITENHNWDKLLLDALARIADREQHHDLADSLLQAELDEPTELLALHAAHPSAREAYALRALDLNVIKDAEAFRRLSLLCAVDHPWSESLTRAFLAMARKQTEGSAGSYLSYLRYLPTYLLKMSPACLDDLRELASDAKKNNAVWSNAIKQAASVLEFRQKMLKELSR